MIVYFDSSALMKMIVSEEDAELASELWDAASWRITSHVAYPEVRAALGAASRSRRIDPARASEAILDLERVFASMRLLNLDGDLCWRAGVLAERHALRGYDAVHLASMVGIQAPRVVVATWDRQLGAAASECGLGVVPRPPRSDFESAPVC